MNMKSKVVIAAVGAIFVTGWMKSGNSSDYSVIKKSYSGGISKPLPMFQSTGQKIMDGAMGLALKGSAIPVAGPNIVAPLVSGTYGLLWGWTY